jgi:hypothetical protein
MINWKKIGSYVGAFLVVFLTGFGVAKLTIKPEVKTITKYEKSDPIIDSIPKPYPVIKEVPAKIDSAGLMKYCIDNHLYDYLIPRYEVEKIVYEKVDTMKILTDWLTLRELRVVAFDDEVNGKFVADLTIQYNNLQNFKYNFTPIQKVIENTITKVPKFEPALGIGMMLDNSAIGMAGVYFGQHYGLFYIPRYDFTNKQLTHGIMASYKF